MGPVLRVIILYNLTGQKRYVTELNWIGPVIVSGDSPEIISSPDMYTLLFLYECCFSSPGWIFLFFCQFYAPIKSKLQHPPRANPGHLTIFCARGVGNLTLPGWGGENWTGSVRFQIAFWGAAEDANSYKHVFAFVTDLWAIGLQKKVFKSEST